jgi:chaperonin GroES
MGDAQAAKLSARTSCANTAIPQKEATSVPETATRTELQPLGDRVVVEAVEQAKQSAGGVILPDTAKEKPQEGIIIAVGPGRKTDKGEIIKIDLKVGDKVIYSKYSGSEIKLEGKEYLIVSEKDVLAIVKR